MHKVITVCIGTLLSMEFVILLACMISACIDVSKANSYKADVISEIENSNFNSNVIASCIAQAQEEDYELEVNKIVTDADENRQIAEVILKYKFTISILGMNDEHEIRGYAR